MAAYIIAEVDIHDLDGYKEYVRGTPDSIAEFGGEFIVRGGDPETLEGDWSPRRVVVIRFKDRETLEAWYKSETYAPLKALRQKSAHSRIVAVDGHEDGGTGLTD